MSNELQQKEYVISICDEDFYLESMNKPQEVQIVKLKSGAFKIDTQKIFAILDKVSNKNIAVVSINGNKRTGKSFILNYFLRYLQSENHEQDDWIYSSGDSLINGFEWGCGADRITEGIWMWSEPFIVKAFDNTEIALFLLDTQGNFDEKTTFKECGVLFSISALISSTIIMNIKNELSEDKLQFLEFFTDIAELFSGEANLTGQFFQQLVFLVRDWASETSYSYGCHDNNEPTFKNYKKNVIDPNDSQCNEAQRTRSQLLSNFTNVISFLMPHPGLKVNKTEFIGQTDLLEEEFVQYVKRFVPLVLDRSRMQPKKICGQTVTGSLLKAYLSKWAETIETHKVPYMKTLAEAAADVTYMLAFKHAITLYETKIKESLELKLNETEFADRNKIVEEESIHYFITEPRRTIPEHIKKQMLEDLKFRINQFYEISMSNNCARIDKEKSELNLKEASEKQRTLQIKVIEHQAETDSQIEQEKQKMEKEIESIRLNEIQLQLDLIKEKAKLGMDVLQQKLNYITEILEMEKKNWEGKIEAEKNNSDKMLSLIAEIRKPPLLSNQECTIS